ncbi:hypothetical protein ACFU5O_06695 [Streptomyces sp. NPDC057445]|uniref:hypothetical protein n=1 Tax=Streptomyces sp. NPDC057445 TaxID=3346136 RepID=UPI00368CBA88
MPDTAFPYLGRDPAPGSPTEIAALRTKLAASAASLGTAHRLVERLLGESSTWQGEAATAFRNALDGDLPRCLHNAHRSLSKAATRLGTWHDDLIGYQATARTYESRARLESTALTNAEAHESSTRARPDAPATDLAAAMQGVTQAREALAGVRKLARELEETHRLEAARIAKELGEATERLAPVEPGAFDGVLKWVDENLGDGLSTLSAALGLVAVFATGVAVPLLFVAAGLSLAALVVHARDTKVQAALKGGFTKGEFDGKFWAASAALTGDALGAVPGLAAVSKGAVGAARASAAAGEGLSRLHAGVRSFGTGSNEAMQSINDAPKPLLDWTVRSSGERVSSQSLQAGVAGTGVATSSVGLTSFEDQEGVQAGGATIDGARLGTSDVPNLYSAARAWSQAR